MKQGDFTGLAEHYKKYRKGYSQEVLRVILAYTGLEIHEAVVADIGAGTGKFTEQLWKNGLKGFAVEPNDDMRQEGVRLWTEMRRERFLWLKGSAESTTLADRSVNWVTMASAFHWVDHEKVLAEFYRILKPGGFVTLLWNPRDIQRSSLEQRVELIMREVVPNLKRASSGFSQSTEKMNELFSKVSGFENLFFVEASHDVTVAPEEYLGVWKSVNDVRAQAGEDRFQIILKKIEAEVAGMKEICIPYRTRAWTARKAV